MARVTLAVRSGPSRKACYLRFINRTSRKVNVLWVDYRGYTISYGTLNPNRHFDIHTYEGHPWICEDSETKTRLLLNKVEVFYPSSESDLNQNTARYHMPMLTNNELIENDEIVWKREYVNVTLPVFSLLDLSAEVILRNIRSYEDIRLLEIPTRLRAMLQSLHYYL